MLFDLIRSLQQRSTAPRKRRSTRSMHTCSPLSTSTYRPGGGRSEHDKSLLLENRRGAAGRFPATVLTVLLPVQSSLAAVNRGELRSSWRGHDMEEARHRREHATLETAVVGGGQPRSVKKFGFAVSGNKSVERMGLGERTRHETRPLGGYHRVLQRLDTQKRAVVLTEVANRVPALLVVECYV